MENSQHQFYQMLIAETRRRIIGENVPRIKKCLLELSEAEIWYRPNPHSNSMGNLVLHLCGNVRQWLLSGLGKATDQRKRQQEFDEQGPIPRAELFHTMDQLMVEVDALLDTLSPSQLLAEHQVQVYRESGVSILIHVIEHFSYHTGQIAFFVKYRKDLDLGFYAGINLEVK